MEKPFDYKSMRYTVISAALIGALFGAIAGAVTTQNLNMRERASGGGHQEAIRNTRNRAPSVFSEEEAIVATAEEVTPAVVSIIVSRDLPIVERRFTDPFGGFLPFRLQVPQFEEHGTERRRIGGGSGFIISRDGLVVTNRHVVEQDDVNYTVVMSDGSTHEARVLGRDPIQDLAILKIEASNLDTVRIGDSAPLKIGQKVIAIGYALGEFQNTVSLGVISGLSRSIVARGGLGQSSEALEGLIQTDAAINQGNSGGPLLNLSGEVIGVNTAMAIGAENIGFAIPINNVQKDIKEVKEKGKITYPFLGVRYVLITPELQSKHNLPVDYGALVTKGSGEDQPAVVPKSPAEAAGIQEGDIILEISGKRVGMNQTLARLLVEHHTGDTVTLRILRDGKEMALRAQLAERNT